MADIQIEAAAYTTLYRIAQRGGVFWTSPLVGYVVYTDSLVDLKYQKTADGGATWGGAINIRTGNIVNYDCWADWQTAGDAGTKIHIAYIDSTSDDIRYVYLDTSTDSIGGDDQIEAAQGAGTLNTTGSRSNHSITITKTRGGNLAVAFRYLDTTPLYFYRFYTSPDGDTWTSKTSPWEDTNHYMLLFPGNEADNQDVWATFWDIAANEISLKTYDDSGNSWSEQLISANMLRTAYYIQMDGAIRLSDGHLIFAAWNTWDNVASDLMVWDINGAGSITAKTNVITNEAETFLASVFINQVNDDIYIAYVSGTTAQSAVAAFYQKSVNGGTTWGGETALQADVEDDERWISAGAMKATWGGRFQPVWFNDDLNDLFTNKDNGTSIWAPPVSDIDVGADPIDRPTSYVYARTRVDKNNPANASGTLHSIKIWASENMTGLRVGTFYTTNGDTLKCRDSATIGAVEAGAERTFTEDSESNPLAITIVEGDYIGCYYDTGFIEGSASGYDGLWAVVGEYIDPNDEATYSFQESRAISIYGYGDIVAAPENTVYLVKATGKRTQLSEGAVAIRIDPTTGRRSLDTTLTKFLVREDDGTLKAKSA